MVDIAGYRPYLRSSKDAAFSEVECASARSSRAGAYRSDIDGLRAIAVLSVLFYHVGLAGFQGGYSGVDVFFVISGYLITDQIVRTEQRGEFTVSSFYLRRFRRLFPSAALTLMASFCAAACLFSPQHLEQFGGSAVAALLAASNIFFWHTSGYFDTAAIYKPALHTWSLGVEEQFYFVWPALLIWLLRWKGGAVAFASVAVLGAASFALNLVFHFYGQSLTSDAASTMFYLLPFRFFQLALGASIVWLQRYQPTGRGVIEILTVVGLLAVIASIFIFSSQTIWPSFNALLPSVGTGLLVFVGPNAMTKRLIDNPLAVAIGLVSYSLYLVHWPLIVFVNYVRDGILTVPDRLLICLVAIALSIPMYLWVERPVRQRRILASTPWLLAVSTPLMAILIVLGASAYASHGWYWRYDLQIANLIDLSKNPPRYNPLGCFLGVSDPVTAMPNECYAVKKASGRKTVMIVGDSVAESLWYGLQKVLGPAYNVKMWTSSACPPVRVFFTERPACKSHMDAFFGSVLPVNDYDLVLFMASNPFLMQYAFKETVRTMHALNRRFVLLGFPLFFNRGLPEMIAKFGRVEGLDDYIAGQLQRSCSDEYGFPDLVTAREFVSVRALMCRDGKPIYRDGDQLLIFDNVHPTGFGSEFLARRLVPELKSAGLL